MAVTKTLKDNETGKTYTFNFDHDPTEQDLTEAVDHVKQSVASAIPAVTTPPTPKEGLGELPADLQKRSDQFYNAYENLTGSPDQIPNIGGAIDVAGSVAGAALDIGKRAYESVVKPFAQPIIDEFGNTIKDVAANPEVQKEIAPIAKAAAPTVEDAYRTWVQFKKDNPTLAQHIESGLDIAGAMSMNIGGVTEPIIKVPIKAVVNAPKATEEASVNIGKKVIQSYLKPPIKAIDDGFKPETVYLENIEGNNAEQIHDNAKNKTSSLYKEMESKLSQGTESGAVITPENSLATTLNEIKREPSKHPATLFAGRGEDIPLNKAINEIYGTLENMYGDPSKPIDLLTAQKMKQTLGSLSAFYHGVPDKESSALEYVAGKMYVNMKNDIEAASPEGVADLNRRISSLMSVQFAALRAARREGNNNAIGLVDALSATAALASTHGTSLIPAIANRVLRNPKVGKALFEAGGGMKTGPSPKANFSKIIEPDKSELYKALNQVDLKKAGFDINRNKSIMPDSHIDVTLPKEDPLSAQVPETTPAPVASTKTSPFSSIVASHNPTSEKSASVLYRQLKSGSLGGKNYDMSFQDFKARYDATIGTLGKEADLSKPPEELFPGNKTKQRWFKEILAGQSK